MTRKSSLAFLALAICMTVATEPAHAQIGGLIKKKAAEALKKPEPARTEAEAEAAPPGLRDTDVIPISDETLGYFRRGLEVEIAERAALMKFLAAQKTPEQYQACQSGVAMSEEGQQIVMSMGELPENATQAQMQAAVQKMNDRMSALLLKSCGEDPQKYSGNWRTERLQEIEKKAADAAGPPSGASAESSTSFEPSGPWVDEGLDQRRGPAGLGAAGMTPRQYALLKERVVPFCIAVKDGFVPPNTPFVKLPGTGRNVFWVYTQEEAQALMKTCDTIMPLLDQVL